MRTLRDPETSSRDRWLGGLLVLGLVGVLLHDLGDFGLEFLGVGVPFCLALGIVGGITASPSRPAARQPAAAGVLFVGLALGTAMSAQAALPRLSDRVLEQMTATPPTGTAQERDQVWRRLRAGHPADEAVTRRAVEHLHAYALASPRGSDEQRQAVQLSEHWLNRLTELSNNANRHLLLSRGFRARGRRLQGLIELQQAYVGELRREAVSEAISMGASARDLMEFLRADKKHHRAPATAGSLAYMIHWNLRQPLLSVQLIHLLARDRTVDWLEDRPSAAEACRILGHNPHMALSGEPIIESLQMIAARWKERSPNDPLGYLCEASGQHIRGDITGAERALREGLKQVGPDPSLRVRLAALLRQSQRLREARSVADDGPLPDADAPFGADLRIEQGRCRADNPAGGLLLAKRFVEEFPNQVWARRLMAELLSNAGRLNEAADHIRAAASVSGPGQQKELIDWASKLEEKAKAATAPAKQPEETAPPP